MRLFRPAVDSKGHFSVNGTDILGHLDVAFGLVLDYGRDLARVGQHNNSSPPDGIPNRPLVDSLISGTFIASVGLFNWVTLGVHLPFHLVSGPGEGGMTQFADGLRRDSVEVGDGDRIGGRVGGQEVQHAVREFASQERVGPTRSSRHRVE